MAAYYTTDSDSDFVREPHYSGGSQINELNAVLRHTNRNLTSCAKIVKSYTSLNKDNVSAVEKVNLNSEIFFLTFP